MRTTTQHLADLLLGRPVEAWVSDQRAAGRSWRLVARELRALVAGPGVRNPGPWAVVDHKHARVLISNSYNGQR